MNQNAYHFTKTSKKSIEEVLKDLEASLKNEGFGVLWSFKVHEKLAEKGIENNNKITILEVCNPQEAANILDIDPMAGYFLPCKIVITEEDEQTKVGLLSPKLLIGFIEDKKLDKIAEEIENRLTGAIEGAI